MLLLQTTAAISLANEYDIDSYFQKMPVSFILISFLLPINTKLSEAQRRKVIILPRYCPSQRSRFEIIPHLGTLIGSRVSCKKRFRIIENKFRIRLEDSYLVILGTLTGSRISHSETLGPLSAPRMLH